MMKKILILALACTISVTFLISCGNKNNTDSNSQGTAQEQVKKTTKIETKTTKDLITVLAELMDKDDSEVLKTIGTGTPTGEPVLSRKYDTKVLDEDSQVYVNLNDSKVYDISVVLNGNNFDDYEKKITEIFGKKTSEEENTLKDGNGRRATNWDLSNGNVLKLIQVNSQLSISIQKSGK